MNETPDADRTDRELAADLRAAVTALNELMVAAVVRGLEVSAEVLEEQTVKSNSCPHILVDVSRPL